MKHHFRFATDCPEVAVQENEPHDAVEQTKKQQ